MDSSLAQVKGGHLKSNHFIPVEVLLKVFGYCRSSDLFNWNDVPWSLTRVCRHWRQVALADQRLWTRVEVHVDYLLARLPETGGIEALTNIARLTNPHPLDINLHLPDFEIQQSLLQKLGDTIRGSCHRWRSLTCQIPIATSDRFSPSFLLTSEKGVGSLEKLDLDYVPDTEYNSATIDCIPGPIPNLKELSISWSSIQFGQLVNLPWGQITVLKLVACWVQNISSFQDILQSVSRTLGVLFLDVKVSSSILPITLPALHTFHVGDGRYCNPFMVPRLENLEVFRPRTYYMTRVSNMVRRSNAKVKNLTLRADDMNEAVITLEDFLRDVCSTVTELTLKGMCPIRMSEEIVSSPDGFLPRLKSLRVEVDNPLQGLTIKLTSWAENPCIGLSSLETVIMAAKRMRSLKILKIDVYMNTSTTQEEPNPRLLDEIAVMKERVEVEVQYVRPSSESLRNLAALLRSRVDDFTSLEAGDNVQVMTSIKNVFLFIERCLQTAPELLTSTPILREVMMSYADQQPAQTRGSGCHIAHRAKLILDWWDKCTGRP
ncbi:hypothetical protein PQX77_005814 [Marasmius sp. AFHP31]|nr:hypothetical protein PQX77_005814 [Marasmius sp. AFHP31]